MRWPVFACNPLMMQKLQVGPGVSFWTNQSYGVGASSAFDIMLRLASTDLLLDSTAGQTV